MTNSIINPLIDSTIQQLTAIRNVLGDSPGGMFVDAARAQLLATKAYLGGDTTPRLMSAEMAVTGYEDRETVPPRYQMKKVSAPCDTKKKKKKTGPKGPHRNPRRVTWDTDDHDAAILIVLREAGRPLTAPELFTEIYNRRNEFGLKNHPPRQGVRDRLTSLLGRRVIMREGEGREIRWSIVDE